MIVTSIDTIRKYVAINADMEFESLIPYIRLAEKKHLIPTVGQELYDIVNDGIENENLDAWHTDILPYLEAVVSQFAVLAYVPTGNVLITDSGILMSSTENTKPAPLWAKEELQEFLKNAGYFDLDALLEYLSDNADHFPEWTSTDAYKRFKGHFINRTSEFSDIYDINDSYRTFARLRSIINNIEEDKIKEVLGTEYFDELIQKLLDRDENIDDKKVIKLAQKAIVFLTIVEACDTLPVSFSDEGLVVISYDSVSVNKISRPAQTLEIISKRNSAYKKASEYLLDLKNHLNNTASNSVLTTYFNSDAYTDPSKITIDNNNINDSDSKIILL